MISQAQYEAIEAQAERDEDQKERLVHDLMSGNCVPTGAKTEISPDDILHHAQESDELSPKWESANWALMAGEPDAAKALQDVYELAATELVEDNFEAWCEWQAEI